MEQSAKRAHRADGTAANYEVVTLARSATLEDVRPAMDNRRADLRDLLLDASGEPTCTTGSRGHNFFEQALEIWSEDRW